LGRTRSGIITSTIWNFKLSFQFLGLVVGHPLFGFLYIAEGRQILHICLLGKLQRRLDDDTFVCRCDLDFENIYSLRYPFL
jgi:hypothetical protein